MSEHIGTLRGIRVLQVQGTDCDKCALSPNKTNQDCPSYKEEAAAGFKSCLSGAIYVAALTTEQLAEQIAERVNAELLQLDQTKHSAVLRILQSKLGQRRTAAIFKPK